MQDGKEIADKQESGKHKTVPAIMPEQGVYSIFSTFKSRSSKKDAGCICITDLRYDVYLQSARMSSNIFHPSSND